MREPQSIITIFAVDAVVSLLIPTVARAQVDGPARSVPNLLQLRSLSTDVFAATNLFGPPTSNFSPGWDSIKSVAIAEDRLLRPFYRKSDGLMVGVTDPPGPVPGPRSIR